MRKEGRENCGPGSIGSLAGLHKQKYFLQGQWPRGIRQRPPANNKAGHVSASDCTPCCCRRGGEPQRPREEGASLLSLEPSEMCFHGPFVLWKLGSLLPQPVPCSTAAGAELTPPTAPTPCSPLSWFCPWLLTNHIVA